MKIVALTTVDNPFDPFEDFASWFAFDERQGYHTCALLGRLVDSSHHLPSHDQVRLNDEAIATVIKWYGSDLYKRVEKVVED